MRSVIFNFLMCIFVSTLYLPNAFAQDYIRWHLPEGATVRLGKGEINDIQYSRDGTRLAVASSIGVWLYNTATRQEIALLTGDTSPVGSVIFSPDGRTLASKSKQGPIRLWNAFTGREKKSSQGTRLCVRTEIVSRSVPMD